MHYDWIDVFKSLLFYGASLFHLFFSFVQKWNSLNEYVSIFLAHHFDMCSFSNIFFVNSLPGCCCCCYNNIDLYFGCYHTKNIRSPRDIISSYVFFPLVLSIKHFFVITLYYTISIILFFFFGARQFCFVINRKNTTCFLASVVFLLFNGISWIGMT